MTKKRIIDIAQLKLPLPEINMFIGKRFMCKVAQVGKGRNHFKIVDIKHIPEKPYEPKETIPMEGHTKYFIANSRLGIYTSIGADNLHHASNKATKLFGPSGWSFIRDEYHVHDLMGYHAKIYKDYKELINTLSI